MADMPRNLRYLTGEVERLANERGIAMLRLRTLVANEVVAQMLPEGVVKGGTSIKFRYGDAATRFPGAARDCFVSQQYFLHLVCSPMISIRFMMS